MSDGLFDDLEELPHVEIEEKAKELDRDLLSQKLLRNQNILHLYEFCC